jgi:hypothetical protein
MSPSIHESREDDSKPVGAGFQSIALTVPTRDKSREIRAEPT